MSVAMSKHPSLWRLCLGILGTLLVCGPLLSQDSPPAEEAPGTSAPAEGIIYVPFDELDKVLEQPDGSVVLPFGEYQELWRRAQGAEQGVIAPRFDAVITRADYRAVVDGELARITADFRIHVIGRPWVELPLKFGDAAVGQLTSDEGDVLLRGTGEGACVLLLGQAGEQSVTLELTARVTTSPEGASFASRSPPSASPRSRSPSPRPTRLSRFVRGCCRRPTATRPRAHR